MTSGRRAVGLAVACLLTTAAACGSDDDDDAPPDAAVSSDAGPPIDEPYPPGAPYVGWFRDVTDVSGLDVVHRPLWDDFLTRSKCMGIAVGDVNGDDRLDVLVGGGLAPASLFLGQGGLRFVDATASAGIDAPRFALGVALGDLDGDGDLDAIVTGERELRLFLNDGAGSFADATEAAGFADTGSAQGVLLADVDDDGLTDVYVSAYVFDYFDLSGRDDQLYLNRGDGSFEDVSELLGVRHGFGWLAASFDYDGDGDRDLYVANDTFVPDVDPGPPPASAAEDPLPDFLYRNDGPGADGYPVLVEVGSAAGIDEFRSTMGVIAADLTGDGIMDVYLSDWGRNDLLAGNGDGAFTDATDAAGVDATWRIDRQCPAGVDTHDCLLTSWAAAYEDFDLDGARDLIVLNSAIVTGGLAADERQPAAVWQGQPGGAYAPVQTALGWLGGRGMVPADLDDDGDLDLVITTWDGPVRVFENTSATATTAGVRVALRGSTSNPAGLGARVRAVFAATDPQERLIGAGGVLHSWPPTEAHFGAAGDQLERLEVHWPSGYVQTVTASPDARVVVVEEPMLVELSRRTAPADGATTVSLTVTPADAAGAPLGAGRSVAIESTGGTWAGAVIDVGDGSYTRQLVAPSEPIRAVITVSIDGAPLAIRPRVQFR